MTSPAIRGFLVEFFAAELDLSTSQIDDDASLVADLGFDSLSFAMGMAEIKRRYSIVLSKDDIYGCMTFGDLVGLVEQRALKATEQGRCATSRSSFVEQSEIS